MMAGLSVPLAIAALVACAADGEPSATGQPRVVATTTQVGSAAREVGGDAIDLTVLLAPGVEAHDFALTPEQGAALEGADIILVSGAGLEDWLADTIAAVGAEDRVRDMSEGIALRSPDAVWESEEAAGAVDPHYWLSGPNAVSMVGNVRDALAAADPGGSDGYDDRAADLVERLDSADAEVRGLIDEVPVEDRGIVTDHDALGYFIDEYGLRFVGSVFPSLDVSAAPSAQDIEELVALIAAEGVTAIFTESSVDPRLAEAVAAETDARLVDEPLYTDSLGPPGSGADTLDGMLVHNARVIRDGLLDD
jgi:zinc/manganese transport system substrate-binding protein